VEKEEMRWKKSVVTLVLKRVEDAIEELVNPMFMRSSMAALTMRHDEKAERILAMDAKVNSTIRRTMLKNK
jgi:hypothetical protein